jgi:hypothetical protein
MAERKLLATGGENPKYVDLLDEDPGISGQKFTCVSFISPETILKKRELFIFGEFVKQWDASKSMEKFGEFLNFLSFKYSLNGENLMADYTEFVNEEETKIKAGSTVVDDDFKTYSEKNEERLNLSFSRVHDFQTSVRGLKIRGSFSTQEEAEINCKKIRERDPHHDIFVAPVGVWLPWEPDAYKTGRVEHLEPELNRLMQEKMQNEIKAKQEFDDRVKAAKRKAIEENIKKARESGNVLTQTLDENGNLVGANTINYDEREVSDPKEQERLFKEAMDAALLTTSSDIKVDDTIDPVPDV